MKLTSLQIQGLYAFTQKHYVDWYDVQTELVDHLANGIEEHLKLNPDVTFESALKSEFKKFGIMGFSDVIEEKTKALNKYYRKLVWYYFSDFFKLPKIILTLFLIWSYYLILENISDRLFLIIPTVTILMVVPISFLVFQSKQINKLKKQSGKKWLFNSVSMQLGGFLYLINIIIQVLLFPSSTWSSSLNLIFSIVVILFGLALYISMFIVAPKLRKNMSIQHPEYKFL